MDAKVEDTEVVGMRACRSSVDHFVANNDIHSSTSENFFPADATATAARRAVWGEALLRDGNFLFIKQQTTFIIKALKTSLNTTIDRFL